MKSVFFTLALFCFAYSSCQPPRISDPPFTVGDYILPLEINKVLNHSSDSLQLSEFKNQLLILDFMSIGCISCLRALSRFDSLHAQFGRRLQFVLVTQDKTDKVAAFMNSNRIGKEIHFPVITEDSILETWFPHQFIPHEVWIYRNKIVAITNEDYVDQNNIELALSGRPFHLPLKQDVLDFDYKKPMLVIDDQVVPKLAEPVSVYYTSFTGYMQGIPPGVRWLADTIGQYRRVMMVNQPVIRLYANAFHMPALPPSYIVLKVKDASRFVFDSAVIYHDEWNRNNSFCYEAVLPLTLNEQQLQQKIISDLNIYCHATASLEKRIMDCYVLTLKDKTVKPVSFVTGADLEEFSSIGSLIYRLNHSFYSLPFIDETGSRGKNQLFFSKKSITDIPLLQKQLEQFGLRLTKQSRELQVLVLTDN
jgi:hypothetical protein